MDSQRLRVSLRTWLLGVVVFPTIILGTITTLAKRNGYRLAWTTRTQRSLEARVGGGAFAHRRAKIKAYLPWTRELMEFRDGTILTLVHWPTVHPRIIIVEEEEQSFKNATLDEQSDADEALDRPFWLALSQLLGLPDRQPFVDVNMQKPVFEIDGLSFNSLDEFFDVFGATVLENTNYGRNLDAFNDVLRGGFGSPDGGFILRWKNSNVSRDRLGYAETIRFIERKLGTCHPSNVVSVLDDLKTARNHKGETLFDIICGILHNHGPGGEEAEDGIVLKLAWKIDEPSDAPKSANSACWQWGDHRAGLVIRNVLKSQIVGNAELRDVVRAVVLAR